MGFVKTKEELAAYYGYGVRQFPNARILGVMFETDPQIVARLLPPPLKPVETPAGLIFVAEYPETNLGPGYREAALFLNCSYRGERGSYCLSMPIESEEARLYNGRDIFGFPKKQARIHLEKRGATVTGWVERHGIRFVEIEAALDGELPEMPEMGANFLFKGMPRVDLQPGFDGPVYLCRQKTEIAMKRLEIGGATLTLTWSDRDPWAELDNPNVVLAFYLVSDNRMLPGSLLAEVDPEAFLPYYFKMTDFFQAP